jgi:ABC-2 type transport system permease protein
LALPPTYVFEGLRALVQEGVFRPGDMLIALGLNAAYLTVGYALFSYFLQAARRAGSLVQMGE